jgi:hypothetical protein
LPVTAGGKPRGTQISSGELARELTLVCRRRWPAFSLEPDFDRKHMPAGKNGEVWRARRDIYASPCLIIRLLPASKIEKPMLRVAEWRRQVRMT